MAESWFVKKTKINNLQKAPAVNVLARLQLPGEILCVQLLARRRGRSLRHWCMAMNAM